MTEEIIPTNGTSADDVKYAKRVEEVYIDGVNVAGCCQLIEEPFYPCGLGGECKGWENCYYKQLKQAENTVNECHKYLAELEDKIESLEQERNEWKKKYEDVANENLKEIYELIKKNDCWRGVVNVVCSKLERENKELKEKAPMKLIAKNNAYRSALEEIRENLVKLKTNDEDDFTYEYSKIEDKINEALNLS